MEDSICPASKPWFVGDQHASSALVDAIPKDSDYFVTGAGVERAGGFVGKQELSGADKGSCYGNTLRLATGDFFRKPVVDIFQPDLCQCGFNLWPQRFDVSTS